MNSMTSFPEGITRTRIQITGVTVAGGFARAECDGRNVYVSRSAVRRLNLRPGDHYDADLVPNQAQPEKTPWFAMHIADPNAPDSGHFLPSEVLEHLQSAGDAWTARQCAEVFLDHEPTDSEVAAMHRVLDQLYLGRKGISKVMLFREAGAGGPAETWFTAVPDSIDVGEFED